MPDRLASNQSASTSQPPVPFELPDFAIWRVLLGGGGDNILIGDFTPLGAVPDGGPLAFGSEWFFGGAGDDRILGDSFSLDIHASQTEGNIVIAGSDVIFDLHPEGYNLVSGDIFDLNLQFSETAFGVQWVAGGYDIIVDDGGRLTGDFYSLSVSDAGAEPVTSGPATLGVLAGNDLLIGGSRIQGDAGYVDVTITSGSNAVLAFGDDVIVGSDYDGIIFGDFNTLYATIQDGGLQVICGDDTIVSGAGDETIYGDMYQLRVSTQGSTSDFSIETGSDTYIFSGSFGNDKVGTLNVEEDVFVFAGYAELSEETLSIEYVDDNPFTDQSGDRGTLITIDEAEGSGSVFLSGYQDPSALDIIFV